MIKWIKNLFCKIIGVKQCECPDDEHIEYYTKVPKPEIPKWECGVHNRYKKSCPTCKELAGEI